MYDNLIQILLANQHDSGVNKVLDHPLCDLTHVTAVRWQYFKYYQKEFHLHVFINHVQHAVLYPTYLTCVICMVNA